jgi:hypothetical protein
MIPPSVLRSDTSSENMPGSSGNLQGSCIGMNVGRERAERSLSSSLPLTAAGREQTGKSGACETGNLPFVRPPGIGRFRPHVSRGLSPTTVLTGDVR